MRVVYNALAVSHMERGNFLEANRVFAQAMEAMSAQQEMGLVRARARCNRPRRQHYSDASPAADTTRVRT